MITSLHVQNFKCHKSLELGLGSLTLLSGYNAGGKSSTIQGALLLHQAMIHDDRSHVVALNGKIVKLGTISDVMRDGGKESKKITLGLTVGDALLQWEIEAIDRNQSTSCVLTNVKLIHNGIEKTQKIRPQTKLQNLVPASFSNKLVEQCVASLRTFSALSTNRGSNQEIFGSPEIGKPTRGNVGINGEFAAWWLATTSDEDINPARRCQSDESLLLRRQLNAWGNQLFPGFEVNSFELERTGLYQLQFRTKFTDAYRKPSNVGYGLTYAFPILVSCLTADNNQTLFIDSPEAHLHPQAQSEMGRFLATIAASGVQIIIETHSDHILNGIRVAVREEKIRHDSVKIHFLTQNSGSNELDGSLVVANSSVSHIEASIDSRGRLDKWPSGFFDQIETDLAKL